LDLLIEAIVWLLRSLFGDPEKPADMSRTQQRGGKRGGQRGPYNYGDSSSSGSAPKTLEQILEEVRQQAAQGRSAPEQRPPPPPRPPKPPKIPKIERVEVEEEKKPVPLSASLSTPSEPAGMPLAQELPRMAQQAQLQHLPEREQRPEQIPAAEAAQAMGKARKKKKPVAASVPVPAGPTGVDIIRAIRSASPQGKLAAARQAVVVSEVFGAPRSRRPLRPGARMF